jgi:prepilin-type N-terminal cleavage/methylation domain-containing protein
MRRAFSIAELMIVVAIIGILAALVVPYFQNYAIEAKEAAAKDNLRILRSAIELYAAQHGGVAPGYDLDDINNQATAESFAKQMVGAGGCLRKMPRNPFNNLDTMHIIGNSEALPAQATGDYGWIYKPAAKTIRLDWPGSDLKDVRYFEY